jgi:hypothetical protein
MFLLLAGLSKRCFSIGRLLMMVQDADDLSVSPPSRKRSCPFIQVPGTSHKGLVEKGVTEQEIIIIMGYDY